MRDKAQKRKMLALEVRHDAVIESQMINPDGFWLIVAPPVEVLEASLEIADRKLNEQPKQEKHSKAWKALQRRQNKGE